MTTDLFLEILVQLVVIVFVVELLGWLSGRYGTPFKAFRVARHEKRLADRLQRGEDRYLDELRTLRAYDPAKSPSFFDSRFSQRCVTYVMVAVGLALADLGTDSFFDWAFSK